jgi:hypothetical protein
MKRKWRYLVCTIDPGPRPDDEFERNPFASALTAWGLRVILRILYARGYDVVSITVEKI